MLIAFSVVIKQLLRLHIIIIILLTQVERIVSEHHKLMSSMSYPTQPSMVGEDLASDVILMKIAELAPILAREACEVNALCKMTGQ